MSNKQSLSFEKCIHFIFHYFKYSLHLFKRSTVLGCRIFSTYKTNVLFINKSSQSCNTVNKYKVAITCAFGRRLCMSTISAVTTCTANMHMRATLHNNRVLRYLICFWKKNAANTVDLCVLRAHFSPVKCSETIFPLVDFTH